MDGDGDMDIVDTSGSSDTVKWYENKSDKKVDAVVTLQPTTPFRSGEDIDKAIAQVRSAVEKLRELSPLSDMYKDGIDMDKIEWATH